MQGSRGWLLWCGPEVASSRDRAFLSPGLSNLPRRQPDSGIRLQSHRARCSAPRDTWRVCGLHPRLGAGLEPVTSPRRRCGVCEKPRKSCSLAWMLEGDYCSFGNGKTRLNARGSSRQPWIWCSFCRRRFSRFWPSWWPRPCWATPLPLLGVPRSSLMRSTETAPGRD